MKNVAPFMTKDRKLWTLVTNRLNTRTRIRCPAYSLSVQFQFGKQFDKQQPRHKSEGLTQNRRVCIPALDHSDAIKKFYLLVLCACVSGLKKRAKAIV